ncbi:Fic family protein [Spiroplasma diminutum]|uniref:Fic family protein n=1 Tax=Spiroplasma diminutum CUAS-1 TaxID=1276221 RepID=S5MIV8_9MOLU|nr:Fic family protein [Spiroplasma diminutum]AGR41870.1 Fic family protein [Spiroplasma diminutum CUAS-1]
MKKELYKIWDVKFNPLDFKEQANIILEKFEIYNQYLNSSPFDTQFLSMQLLKYEARHSNMIEGIDTNDIELLAANTPLSKKISNYVNALKDANEELINSNIVSKDLVLNIHKNLFLNMMSVDAINANPGVWRVKQVQIANHMPPPPIKVDEYMSEFIDWINDSSQFKGCSKILESIVKAAITHAYFEKIHPFTDGNGRAGRILFNIVLNRNNLTTKPYFYISKAILHEQFLYYQELAKLDESNDYQKWIKFFLDLLIYQLESNIKTFEAAMDLFIQIKREMLQEEESSHREVKRAMMNYMVRYPIFTFSRVYFKIKPLFEKIDDPTFVMIFDELVNHYKMRKIPETKNYEFSRVVDIIVGKDW